MYNKTRPINKKYHPSGKGSDKNNKIRMDVHKFIRQQVLNPDRETGQIILIVATPGRLIDMADRGYVFLDRFKILVLDEFDRMLDMGFLPEVKRIHSKMRNEKQTLLFSATMNESQKTIVDSMTHFPVKVTAGSGNQPIHAIEQDVLNVGKDRNKSEVLYDLISQYKHQKVLLFCETKRKVIKVNKKLQQDNIHSDMIHGDKTQRSREIALEKFRNGRIQVLVAPGYTFTKSRRVNDRRGLFWVCPAWAIMIG